MTPAVHLPRAQQPRRRSAVAVLVFALLLALVGAAVLLVIPADVSALTGPTATVQANGLVFTLRVAPGPYFVRELLPVGISLTNHSDTTLYVEGHAGMNQFGAAFQVTQEGGGAPTYQIPSPLVPWSSPMLPPTGLPPGRTMSVSDLLPLTGSGHLTLSVGVSVDTVTFVSGGGQITRGPDPFAARGPTLHLTVAASAPLNRTVGLWRMGARLVVLAPPQALAHLVYQYTETHSDSSSLCLRGNGRWQPITTLMIDGYADVCGGHYTTWSYAVGAPGYAVPSRCSSSHSCSRSSVAPCCWSFLPPLRR
jgi:hypothetical protein